MACKFRRKNSVAVGMPRQGKSHFVKKELQKYEGAVLYINPKAGEKGKSPFIIADGRNTMTQIVRLLKKGKKIEYRLNGRRPDSAGEICALIDALLDAGFDEFSPVMLAIDEMHYYEHDKELDKKTRELAMTGVSLGVSSVFMSQRFANINYDAIAVCEDLYFFKLSEMERTYIMGKKWPYDEIMSRIEQKGKYSYCTISSDRGFEGAFKEAK